MRDRLSSCDERDRRVSSTGAVIKRIRHAPAVLLTNFQITIKRVQRSKDLLATIQIYSTLRRHTTNSTVAP
jgi:hypothetical protein